MIRDEFATGHPSGRDPDTPVPPACAPAPDGRCGICADEALPGRVIAIDREARTADVEVGVTTRTVALDLVEHVDVGDALLVHQGFAIGRLEDA